MRRFTLVFALCCACGSAQAFDTATAGLVGSGYVTSQLTSLPLENKLIIEAREDAASFVASGGQVHGVRLEAALRWLRHSQPELAASDLELAQIILVQ
ncbi:DUF2388 domain-containing protein [Stutzerimonas stutzeri]|uniref:DUF2388 domain-containing protein n=1 Tax=Stutzerimonas stutzeri TaxID=316 RepID=UPI00210B1B69|nr:DUF2388 domain-containing protein [Stutzerimonas stutzeri]MCQ4319036.1 DUF2388 domain-containing protein [Stutzerimonas stutzeri]